MNWFVQMKYTYEYSNMVPGIPCIVRKHSHTPMQSHRHRYTYYKRAERYTDTRTVKSTYKHRTDIHNRTITHSPLTLALKLLKIFNTENRKICNLLSFLPSLLVLFFFIILILLLHHHTCCSFTIAQTNIHSHINVHTKAFTRAGTQHAERDTDTNTK